MRMRNGKTLVEMAHPKKYSLPHNDALDTENQPIRLMVSGVGNSTSIRVIAPVISQMSVLTTLP